MHLELKKTTDEQKDRMHTACAFLNGAGGWLVFGVVQMSLKILGQEVTDNTQRVLAQALSCLEPSVSVDIKYIDSPNRLDSQVIAMYFEAFVWGTAPYTYHGSPYILIVGLQLVVDNLIRCFSSESTAPSIMALPEL